MHGARLIWAGILGIFGCFSVCVNGGFLFFYERCMANSTCAGSAPSNNTGAFLSLLIGLLLVWGALRTVRPSAQPSRLALRIIIALCAIYIAVPLLHAKGLIGFSWASDMPVFNMIVAGITLILTFKRLRQPQQ